MITQRAFWGSTVTTASVFTILFALGGVTVLAALAMGLGVLWLIADVKLDKGVGTGFFLAFVVLAAISGANKAPMPLTLLGMIAALAAWDLSRLRVRLMVETDCERRVPIEVRHIRLLAVTLAAGFLAAMLPIVVHLTISFVIMSGVTLVTLTALTFAVRGLGANPQPHGPTRSFPPKNSM